MKYDDIEERWHALCAAMVTQVGEIYHIVVPLPYKIDGSWYEVVINGIGTDLISAECSLDEDRTSKMSLDKD